MRAVRLRLSLAAIVFTVALACGACLSSFSCAAEGPTFTVDHTSVINRITLKGIDTLAVEDIYGPGTGKLIDLNHIDTKAFLTNAVRKIFAEANAHLPASDDWITIKSYPNEITDVDKPNVLSLNFVLSARQEDLGGQLVTIGALELIYVRTLAGQPSTVETQPASYPFIVPSDPALLQTRIEDGVRHLASYLPSYIVCTNKRGQRSEKCPDCVPTCRSDIPYGGE